MSSERWLAIVGSRNFAAPGALAQAGQIIHEEIREYRPYGCVSGGADGIDPLFQSLAGQHGYTIENGRFVAHPPKYRRWQPEGFKARNILIGDRATRLVSIRCHAAKTYGSGWTADYAEKIGRDVRRVVL